jgi:hypothetical protein
MDRTACTSLQCLYKGERYLLIKGATSHTLFGVSKKCCKTSQIILEYINNPIFISDTIRVHLRAAATYQSRYADEATTSNRTERRFHSANRDTTLTF